ncbi:ras and ef-hand domain-containing protein [Anaeramoeba flamelloides]|uniref:Ras and ef-hand domain-containing protein n=1 Tax=Anaeramoeba flamelloides TaxID=1746091 RepID=A0AAV8AAN6_9EUKA|nr:ras and ef-hand domain-containing protein [Anaeramoeba flamelloides]KAJ6234040.1 ras and ef-hand domain-containing protein [Anaeramoeba flamelloides]
MSSDFEEMGLKIILIGNSLVGKSCLLHQFCDQEFDSDIGTTIGVDFRFSSIKVDEKDVKLQVWDTAGQERFRTITSTYYRSADGILLIYSITSKDSFLQISHWFNEIKKNAPKTVATVLLANKKDLVSDRNVSTEEGQKLADELGLPFLEVSAKTGENVQEAFQKLARLATQENKPKENEIITLENKTVKKKKCCN